MDSGGWIAVLMMGGTGILCAIITLFRKQPPPLARASDGWRSVAAGLHLELDELRRECQRLKNENTSIKMESDALRGEKAAIERAAEFWRSRYLSATNRA